MITLSILCIETCVCFRSSWLMPQLSLLPSTWYDWLWIWFSFHTHQERSRSCSDCWHLFVWCHYIELFWNQRVCTLISCGRMNVASCFWQFDTPWIFCVGMGTLTIHSTIGLDRNEYITRNADIFKLIVLVHTIVWSCQGLYLYIGILAYKVLIEVYRFFCWLWYIASLQVPIP